MIILGVDPGSRLLGYGLIEKSGNSVRVVDHGTLRLFHKEYRDVPVDETTPSRLKEIHTGLSELIRKHRPTVMAVEKVFFSKNAVSALKLGQARGVVLLTGALHDLEIHEYAATEVKSRITGHGRSDKEQVAKMLRILLGGQEFETADASDALALALAHALVGQARAVGKSGGKAGNSLKALAESSLSRGRALKR